VQHTVWKGTTYSRTAGELITPFWTKLVAKYMQGIYPLCLGRGAGAEIVGTGVKLLISHCGESQALH
jgi:hypothetical protein